MQTSDGRPCKEEGGQEWVGDYLPSLMRALNFRGPDGSGYTRAQLESHAKSICAKGGGIRQNAKFEVYCLPDDRQPRSLRAEEDPLTRKLDFPQRDGACEDCRRLLGKYWEWNKGVKIDTVRLRLTVSQYHITLLLLRYTALDVPPVRGVLRRQRSSSTSRCPGQSMDTGLLQNRETGRVPSVRLYTRLVPVKRCRPMETRFPVFLQAHRGWSIDHFSGAL